MSDYNNCCKDCKERNPEKNCHDYCVRYTAKVLSDIKRRTDERNKAQYKSYKVPRIIETKERAKNARRRKDRKMH